MYVLVIARVIFGSLIIWRGFNILDTSFFRTMDEIARVLAHELQLSFLTYLLYPFISLVQALSDIKIDLGSVNVTCTGSQGPIELLINCLILGAVVIVIESDFHVFLNVMFAEINNKFINTIFTYNLNLTFLTKYCTATGASFSQVKLNPVFFICVTIYLITPQINWAASIGPFQLLVALNPFQKALQFLMG